jgi:hypothetical protein
VTPGTAGPVLRIEDGERQVGAATQIVADGQGRLPAADDRYV